MYEIENHINKQMQMQKSNSEDVETLIGRHLINIETVVTSVNGSLDSYGPYVMVLSLCATGLGDLLQDSTDDDDKVTVVVWVVIL